MYTVYAISSLKDEYIYVGMTSNIEDRLRRHYSGYERSTKAHLPFLLLYTEECEDRISARVREKYWKSGTGKRKLKIMRDELNREI